MDKKFAVGVQVYLKSGGPDMTITKVVFAISLAISALIIPVLL